MRILKILAATAAAIMLAIILHAAVYATTVTHDTTPQKDYNSDDYSFSLTGSGACQTDGTYLITWTVINKSAPPYTTIGNPVLNLNSALTGQVAINPNATQTYTQTVDGTKPSVTSLQALGSWNTDAEDTYTTQASVTNQAACTQPQTTPQNQQLAPIVTPTVPEFNGKE